MRWGVHSDMGAAQRIKGGSGTAVVWKFNYNCALAVIPVVLMGQQSERRDRDG